MSGAPGPERAFVRAPSLRAREDAERNVLRTLGSLAVSFGVHFTLLLGVLAWLFWPESTERAEPPKEPLAPRRTLFRVQSVRPSASAPGEAAPSISPVPAAASPAAASATGVGSMVKKSSPAPPAKPALKSELNEVLAARRVPDESAPRAPAASPPSAEGPAEGSMVAEAAGVEAGVSAALSETEAGGVPGGTVAGPPPGFTALSEQLKRAARKCYPAEARRFRERGVALLRFCVGSASRLDNVQLASSSGSPSLDRAARECVVASAAPYPSEAVGRCFTLPVRFGE